MRPEQKCLKKLHELVEQCRLPLEVLAYFIAHIERPIFPELALVRMMIEESSPQEKATLLWYYAMTERDPEILELAMKNWQASAVLNPSTKDEIACGTISTLLAFDKYEEARKIFPQIKDLNNAGAALRLLYGKTRDPELLKGFHEVMSEVSDQANLIKSYYLIAQLSLRQPDIDKAHEHFMAHRSGMSEKAISWMHLREVLILCELKRFDDALSVINSITDSDARIAAKSAVIVSSNDRALFSDLLTETPTTFKSYYDIARAAFACGEHQRAREYAQEIAVPGPKTLFLARISRLPGGTYNDFNQAMRMFIQLSSRALLDEVRLEFGLAYIHYKNLDEAFKLAQRITLGIHRAIIYLNVYRAKKCLDLFE